jgi:cytochrome c-type biogenesis protein
MGLFMQSVLELMVFIEGFLTFLSPCLLPMLPIYLLYLAGQTNNEAVNRFKLTANTLGFVLGFTLLFSILGMTASFLGTFSTNRRALEIVSGALMVFFGIFYMGLIKIPFLNFDKRVAIHKKASFFGAMLFGATFSLGWSPCTGPFLGKILLLSANSSSRFYALLLILLYCLGLGIPFILSALFFDRLRGVLHFLTKKTNIIKRIAGVMLILSGILMALGIFKYLQIGG